MSRAVKLYDLAPSPNNIKVRLALTFKEIPYEKIPVDPQNREPIIKVSGQPLTPVLLHGEAVIYDSYAIMRYLDANWPSTPRLYAPDRETIKKIEEWELFTRNDGSAPVSTCFGQFFAASPDEGSLRQANQKLNQVASRLEEILEKTSFLMGTKPNAADFTLAPMLYYGALPETAAQAGPIFAFFSKYLQIEKAPKTRDWISRIMAWDR